MSFVRIYEMHERLSDMARILYHNRFPTTSYMWFQTFAATCNDKHTAICVFFNLSNNVGYVTYGPQTFFSENFWKRFNCCWQIIIIFLKSCKELRNQKSSSTPNWGDCNIKHSAPCQRSRNRMRNLFHHWF